MNFVAITLCVASQRPMPKASIYFIIDSVRKLLDTPSYPGRIKNELSVILTLVLIFFFILNRNIQKYYESATTVSLKLLHIPFVIVFQMYEGVSKSFRNGLLERELQMV
jgi:hypothetical protein